MADLDFNRKHIVEGDKHLNSEEIAKIAEMLCNISEAGTWKYFQKEAEESRFTYRREQIRSAA